MQSKIIKHINEKSVICLSCHKQVIIEPIEYGKGHIATCPECGKLAYNGKEG